MRYASGEPSDGFHFLRLAELIFQHAAVGNVLGNRFQDIGRLVGAAHRPAADAHGDGVAVVAFPLHFHPIEPPGAPEFVDQPRVLLGVRENIFLGIEHQHFVR